MACSSEFDACSFMGYHGVFDTSSQVLRKSRSALSDGVFAIFDVNVSWETDRDVGITVLSGFSRRSHGKDCGFEPVAIGAS